MKYPAGGGMNPAARVLREKVRMQAAAMFEESEPSTQIAAELRVSPEWSSGPPPLPGRRPPGRHRHDHRHRRMGVLLAHGWRRRPLRRNRRLGVPVPLSVDGLTSHLSNLLKS